MRVVTAVLGGFRQIGKLSGNTETEIPENPEKGEK